MNSDSDRRERAGVQRHACLSCRQRKLKCDRKQPCANCTGRGVDCRKQEFSSTTGRGIKKPQEQSSALAEILSKLDRIEAFISRTQTEESRRNIASPIESDPRLIRDGDTRITRDDDARDSGAQDNPVIRAGGELVSMSTNDKILLSALYHDLSLSVAPSNTASPDFGDRLDELFTKHSDIQLPQKQETLRLFQTYIDYAGQFQHIVFERHARELIEDVYYQVSHVSMTTAPRGIALVFSIVAISVLLGPFHGSPDLMFPSMRDRLKRCALYIRAAMSCLEQARRRMDHTLENVQAMAILCYLINHIEAFSPRYRILMAEAIAVGRILSLHRIDATIGRREPTRGETDLITQEIKRRVWWYIVATDWMTSIAGGPEDSVYTAQPRTMVVNTPRHINDEDLAKSNFTERPLSQPTTMSYTVHRLKIAGIARMISDEVPNDPARATYDLIVSIDSKFEHFLRELPTFFYMAEAHSPEVRSIDEKYPFIPVQRLVLNMMVNLVRCKLHFPYLVGGPNTALHIFSRHASLKAARSALAAHQGLSAANLSHSADFMKIQGTVHHLVMGAVILATDLCCNKPRGTEREEHSAELMRACTLLASVTRHSQIAAKFLNSLTDLLVKYGIWSPSVIRSILNENAEMPTEYDPEQWQRGNYSLESSCMEHEDLEVSLLFDGLWETFVEQPSAMDMIDLF